MKKVALAVVLMSLIVITSCKKSTTNNAGGTWSFKSINYGATTFATSYGQVTVSNPASAYSNSFATLCVNFYNGLPTTAYTNNPYYTANYQVVGGTTLDRSNQVYITLTLSGTNDTLYHTTGGNGNETVQVTISNGNLSIKGSGIELANANNLSDSSSLNLNIVQP